MAFEFNLNYIHYDSCTMYDICSDANESREQPHVDFYSTILSFHPMATNNFRLSFY